jgi:hypothetical protein
VSVEWRRGLDAASILEALRDATRTVEAELSDADRDAA